MSEAAQQIRKIPIAIPSIGQEEYDALREPLFSGWITQGPRVAEFEKKFAELHNLKHALAVTSCTTGLHLALAAMGIGPGDEVIIPAFTWVATANVVLYCGATPVFCDVDTDTFNMSVSDMKAKLTPQTKAIIPVHLFGLCADIDAIRAAVPPHVKILEDAACAAGAMYKDRYAGALGDMAAFSFHPRKSITTGEGGMVTTNDAQLFETAEKMRNHGAEISEEVRHSSPKPYMLPDFKMLGFNYRMTDLQAAVGVVQLSKLRSFVEERQNWANYYREALKDIAWLRPQATPDHCTGHAYQAFVCFVDPDKAPMPRNEIMDILQQKGIATRPGTHAVHMLDFYAEKYDISPEDYPGARACDQQTMAIPLHNKMDKQDYDYIIEALHELK